MANQSKKEILEDLMEKSLEHLSKLIQFEKTRVYDYLSNKTKGKFKFYLSLRVILFLTLCFFTVFNLNNVILDIFIPITLIASLPFINAAINDALENYNYINFKKKLKKLYEIQLGIQLLLNNRNLLDHFGIGVDLQSQVNEIAQEIEDLKKIVKSKFSKLNDYKIIEIAGLIISILIFVLQNFNIQLNYEIIRDIIFLVVILFIYFFLDDYLTTSDPIILNVNLSLRKLLEKKLIKRLEKYIIFSRNLIDKLHLFPDNKTKKIDALFDKFIISEQKEEQEDKTLFKYFY